MKKNNNKKYLKKRIDIRCDCKHKQPPKDRMKYGTCSCDSFSLRYTLGIVMSNYLYQYIADAKGTIIREDWDIIEKHADAIRDYAEADSFYVASDKVSERFEYLGKERKWREAMFWLTENWEGLWW